MIPPRSLPRASFFLWLARQNPPVLKADLVNLILASELSAQEKTETLIRLNEASEFHRDDPFLLAFAPALGLTTPAQIDAAFNAAVRIT